MTERRYGKWADTRTRIRREQQEKKAKQRRRAEAWERVGDTIQDVLFDGVPKTNRTVHGIPRHEYRTRKKKKKNVSFF